MEREVQFILYNMPEDSGNVKVVIRDETILTFPEKMVDTLEVV